MLEKWSKGDSIILKANPNYWGDKAKADHWSSAGARKAAQRLLELQSGTVDGIDNPGPDDFAMIEADTTLKLYPREALNIFYVGMNNTVPPFDNEKVRQAVAMGIDRQRIVDNFYPTGSIVASHFTPAPSPAAARARSGTSSTPTAAKKLLAEAGFPDGFETELSYRDVVRGYLPRAGPGGAGHPGAAQGEPGHQRQDQRDGIGRVPGCGGRPVSLTACTCWAGAPTIPIRPTSWTTTSAAGASKQFGDGFDDI